MEIVYQYTKRRCDFGRQVMFSEQGPELCDNIPQATAEHKHYGLRNPVHQSTQNTPSYAKCQVNTIRAEYSSSGANHAEGGWPKDVNVIDPEATQRYRRRIEKDDSYIQCVMGMSPGLDRYVLQNNAIDMYNIYYTEMGRLPTVEFNSCRTVNVYRDIAGAHHKAGAGGGQKRPVGTICWQPDGGHKFAVTYLNVNFDLKPVAPIFANVWDVENANQPVANLKPPCGLVDLRYNPRDPHVLVGGLLSGQVAAWDERSGPELVAQCPPHVAHRDYVRSVLFINTKSGQEFFSGGPDGACKWWDLRDLSAPTDEAIIDYVKSSFDVQSMANASGISVLEYEPTIPSRFMVGTENGAVITGNRKGKTPMEKLPIKYDAHNGPVWSLERNPGFLKNFLTVGGWTACVWSEECRESPVLWSPQQRHKITAGIWSPTRLSLLLLTQGNGVISLWDLLRNQYEPTLSMQVCVEPLLCLRSHEMGALVACGNQTGNVYLIELSQNLTHCDKNDKALLTAVFERESKRERILEARLREIRVKMRQAEEGSVGSGESEATRAAAGDRDLLDATTDYMQQVRKELAAM